MADNCKFLVLSTEDFTLPEAGRIAFSASIAADAVNATPYDYRDGFAALVLCDPVNGWVCDLCTSGETVFAITERLRYPGVTTPFTNLAGRRKDRSRRAGGRAPRVPQDRHGHVHRAPGRRRCQHVPARTGTHRQLA